MSNEHEEGQRTECAHCGQVIYQSGTWFHVETMQMACNVAATPLLDSQAYEVNEVDAERLADYHKIGSMPAIVKSVDYGAESLAQCVEMAVDRWYHRGRTEGAKTAATRMRDKCVAMVEDFRQRLQYEPDEAMREALFGEMVLELESLTLDQVEQNKEGRDHGDSA